MKHWRLRPEPPADFLPTELPLLRRLLHTRGVANDVAARTWLEPDYGRDLHDPFLLTDMVVATERLQRALAIGEKIAIFGDYDADGVLATAVLAEAWRQLGGSEPEIYIPDRHEEQYGLSETVIRRLAAQGIKLLVTVDCGISNETEVRLANALGLEVIVTDHHLPPPVLPSALAVINPKREGDRYPEKMLCGAGVAFKLVQALAMSRLNLDIKEGWEKWLLDLVAVATVADMVPITGENRALVHFGLKVLRQTRRPGLRALIRELRLPFSAISEDDIGFMIGPRLNSASRMSHGSEAYRLVTTLDESEGAALAAHLMAKNQERRDLVSVILEALNGYAATMGDRPVLVAGDATWSLGVLGLTANRVVEKIGRTTFLWGKNGQGLVRGSCRSAGEVNVVELMRAAGGREFFTDFGGHRLAGGFSLPAERLPELAPRLNEAHAKLEPLPATDDVVLADAELFPPDITWTFYDQVARLAPYGLDNPKPIFWLPRLTIARVRVFGREQAHLGLEFAGFPVEAIRFFAGQNEFASVRLAMGERIDLLANLEKSFFRSRPELRLRIVDLRPAE